MNNVDLIVSGNIKSRMNMEVASFALLFVAFFLALVIFFLWRKLFGHFTFVIFIGQF